MWLVREREREREREFDSVMLSRGGTLPSDCPSPWIRWHRRGNARRITGVERRRAMKSKPQRGTEG